MLSVQILGPTVHIALLLVFLGVATILHRPNGLQTQPIRLCLQAVLGARSLLNRGFLALRLPIGLLASFHQFLCIYGYF